ncbi:Uncharacterized protein Fot_38298 [Forsythia ovata]|uniref:Uncharacterized protein n=1 Tax=Forsythia ovata TaxID=205694 RepID=A0ABD1S1E9_9LAMI
MDSMVEVLIQFQVEENSKKMTERARNMRLKREFGDAKIELGDAETESGDSDEEFGAENEGFELKRRNLESLRIVHKGFPNIKLHIKLHKLHQSEHALKRLINSTPRTFVSSDSRLEEAFHCC